MRTLKITQLKQNLLGIFADCQMEDYLITRWRKPWIVLIGEQHAWNLYHHKEKYSELPEGIPVFVVIPLGKDDEERV